jgi:hypothetical protein
LSLATLIEVAAEFLSRLCALSQAGLRDRMSRCEGGETESEGDSMSSRRGLTRLLLASLFAIAIAVGGFAAPVIAGANDPNPQVVEPRADRGREGRVRGPRGI